MRDTIPTLAAACITLGALGTLGALATAQQEDAEAPAAGSPLTSLPIVRQRLDNGLRVVLNPDRTVPTVAVSVYYDVGSRNEVRGRSGFAHLF